MNRPHANIEIDTTNIEKWYFFPYTDYDAYDDSDPLYAIVAVFDEFGDVVVYNRPGPVGTYHTTDPSETTSEIYPPSQSFKTALSNILTNPGDQVDISRSVPSLKPWEHHQLDVLVSGLNKDPEILPVEIRALINSILTEMTEVEFKGGPATDTEFLRYMRRSEEFYHETISES